MKILIATYGARNKWAGGVFKYFKSIRPILEKKGHEVCLFDGDNVLEYQHAAYLLYF